jgi:hypothetical protein
MPNEIQLASPDPIDIGWWGDASSSFGVGITLNNLWAVWKWAPGIKIGPKQTLDISWAEAVAVELGLHLAIQSVPLSSYQGRPILVCSDNMGVVAIVNKG